MAHTPEDLPPGTPVLVRATVRERNYRASLDAFTFDVEFAGNSRVTLERKELWSLAEAPRGPVSQVPSNLSVFAVGDYVTIGATVTRLRHDEAWPAVEVALSLDGGSTDGDSGASMGLGAVLSRTPAPATPLAIGDSISVAGEEGVFEIKAVSDDGHSTAYWCVRPFPNLKFMTCGASVLRRA